MDPKLAEIRHTPENPLSSSYLDLNPEHLGWTLHTPHHSTPPGQLNLGSSFSGAPPLVFTGWGGRGGGEGVTTHQ